MEQKRIVFGSVASKASFRERRPTRSVLSLGFAMLMGAALVRGNEVEPGQRLYDEHCALCHGVNLEGQANWMARLPNGRLPAPPHDATGHTWHHSDAQLFQMTKDGLASMAPGYESDMPTFGGVLTDEEVIAVLNHIKSTWPARQQALRRARSP